MSFHRFVEAREFNLLEEFPGAAGVPNVQVPELRNPYHFLRYLEENCTPDMLVADRVGQAWLHAVLATQFEPRGTHTNALAAAGATDGPADCGRYPILNPRLELRSPDGRAPTYHYESFRLHEPPGNHHHYYFPHGDKIDTMDFLRPQDIVPSGLYDVNGREMPFTKELLRAPVRGGAEERYNYVIGGWEQTGNIFKAGLEARAVEWFRGMFRRLRPGGPDDYTKAIAA